MSLTTLDGLALAATLLVGMAMAESSPEQSRKRSIPHAEYLATLRQPSASTVRHISAIQQYNEAAIDAKYHTTDEQQAATRIQQTYRGFRDRRQLEGKTLDPSARWTEAIRELRYREATTLPRRGSISDSRPSSPTERAQANWKKVGQIAEHAVGCSPTRLSYDATSDFQNSSVSQPTDSMLLDLRFFLEMVDSKHRYGANLQVYHEAWQRSITKDNFFEWLDHGEGRRIIVTGCSREKLDSERIRYLSREERRDYEVAVDANGRLRWQKTGELITTSRDYQDSAHGIVAKGSPEARQAPVSSEDDEDHTQDPDSPLEPPSTETTTAHHHQVTRDQTPRRDFRVSPATVLNHLLRASIKPGTYIYVCDTLGRLYAGIKSSGSFQHASFLAGARISSAGLIGIEKGQLTYLSPLSGHYRPTIKSFKTFIDRLKSQGVDLSRLRISHAYGVLLGMEYYGKTKRGLGKVVVRRRARSERRESGVLRRESMGASAVDAVERHWEEEHQRPHGMARLMDDLHLRRRSGGGGQSKASS
ncbi:hypothetical protein B0A55_07999 [Friedmanniomyces simplex]|uniref:Uncharacterized protein n=1 Tax=Friedmanniomyces simplex TaxID=329884 RepID=A0A4U0X9I5_9PEZI|nr:hypothetical protein B0A55_07999 [Friedmanniomyces simplex]